jgi:tetratricopeptide (TPR) repeat protein
VQTLPSPAACPPRSDARRSRCCLVARLPAAGIPLACIPPFVFAANLVCGMVQVHAGSLAEARALLEDAVSREDITLPPTPIDLYGLALVYLALVLTHQGHPDHARARIHQAASRAARSERPSDRSFTAQAACFVHLILRDMDALASAASDGIGSSDFPAIAAVGRLSSGRVLSATGDGGRAIEIMREAIEAYRATGQRIGLPLMLAVLAEAHAATGATAAALACVAEACTVAASTAEIRFLAESYRLEGSLHAALGDGRAAECFERAIAVAREQGARWWELRATTALARLALQPGDARRGSPYGG